MPQYIANVQATSNTSANTLDTFIEITAPSGVQFKVKRFRVAFGDGTQTAGVDNHFAFRTVRKSVAGATGSTFTAIKKNANVGASGCTVKVKNGTTAFSVGTVTDTIDIVAINGRMVYEWIARDDDDMIVVAAAGIFGIHLQSAVASQLFTVSCEWME